jgi:hypothetical protein
MEHVDVWEERDTISYNLEKAVNILVPNMRYTHQAMWCSKCQHIQMMAI